MGIEPTQSAWKAEVLPLNYIRGTDIIIMISPKKVKKLITNQYKIYSVKNKG